MLDLIKRVIAGTVGAEGKEQKGKAPEAVDHETKTSVAACVILLEAAHADYDCTDDEFHHVLETIKTKFGLSHELAEELVELARLEEQNSVGLWAFTNQINHRFSHEEKMHVMEAVWRIVYADGRIDKHEDYFTRKLANLLRLKHRDMINAKLMVKEELKRANPS